MIFSFWLSVFAILECAEPAHLSLGIFKCSVLGAIMLEHLHSREAVLDGAVIVLLPKIPQHSEAVVFHELAEDGEVEIDSATPGFELVRSACRVKVLQEPKLEFRDGRLRVGLTAERFVASAFRLLSPPFNGGRIVAEHCIVHQARVHAHVEFALFAILVEAERAKGQNSATGLSAGRFEVYHNDVFHFFLIPFF